MALLASLSLLISLSLGLAAACQGGAMGDDGDSRPTQGEDMAKLQDWGRQMGEDWLRQSVGIDISRFQLRWDPDSFSFQFTPPPAASSPGMGLPVGQVSSVQADPWGGWTLHLEQSDDLTRLLRDDQVMADLPFRMEMEGGMPGYHRLMTKLVLPLSWRDEFRAEANLPLRTGLGREAWWGGLGLGSTLKLRSDFRSRLGQNLVEAGLGTDWKTDWAGLWTLDVDLRKNYGQGDESASQWLRLHRNF
jgi:hypothetical protein